MKFENFNYKSPASQKGVDFTSIDQISAAEAKGLYTFMSRLRRSQEALIKEYHPADEIRCPVHFCIGQEAIPAALSLTLKHEDYLFSHHRSHGFFLSKVNRMNELFAEMYGKENGANGGKAGSQDVSMSSSRFYSGAILAGSSPLATGAGWALKQRKQPFVAVTATGEAATDEGIFWESVNYAALKSLPVIFIVENNNYSTYSPQRDRSAGCNIAERVQTFGVPAKAFFGNDVVRSYLEVKAAIEHARSGKGPVFLEAFTYRWNSHVGPEDDNYVGYRSTEEQDHWKRLCPILNLEKQLRAKKLLDDASKSEMESSIAKEVAEAFKFAKEGKFPTEPNWNAFNLSGKSPLADRLLAPERGFIFDKEEDQAEVVPGPY